MPKPPETPGTLAEFLAHMQELCERATPGPWEWWTSNSWRRLKNAEHENVLEPMTNRHDGHPDLVISEEDMAFIAACRNALPGLLRVAAAAAATQRKCTACAGRGRVPSVRASHTALADLPASLEGSP